MTSSTSRSTRYSRAFLGLTVACARCHDHKFDPILDQRLYSPGLDLCQLEAACEGGSACFGAVLRASGSQGCGRSLRSSPGKIKGTQKKIDELLAKKRAVSRRAGARGWPNTCWRRPGLSRRPNRGEVSGGKAPGQGHPGEVGRLSETRGRTPAHTWRPGTTQRAGTREQIAAGIPEEVHRDCDVPARGIGKLAAARRRPPKQPENAAGRA